MQKRTSHKIADASRINSEGRKGNYEESKTFRNRESNKLTLEEFVAAACDISRGAHEDAKPEWKSSTWEFARLLKGRKEFSGIDAKSALDLVDWKLTDFDDDEKLQFFAEWGIVRCKAGENSLTKAFELAKQRPLFEGDRFKRFGQFISLAGWLQVIVGENTDIFLPIDSLADLLETSTSTISTYRRIAERQKYIKKVQKETRHRAARYRFLQLTRFPKLRLPL